MNNILTPGDDPRMTRAAKILCRQGWRMAGEGETASLVLCPPGWREEKLRPLTPSLAPGGVLVAGTVSPALARLCRERGAFALALMDDPAYRLSNARATGEGTLAEAIRLFPRTLLGVRVLILGYGACGSQIARLFRVIGCSVFVWSHPGSQARAERDGFPPAKAALLPAFPLVINTVPAPDFMPLLTAALSPGTHFFQVASGPVPDEEELARRGIVCHALPGLPGRFAPETEADAVVAALANAQEAIREAAGTAPLFSHNSTSTEESCHRESVLP